MFVLPQKRVFNMDIIRVIFNESYITGIHLQRVWLQRSAVNNERFFSLTKEYKEYQSN